MPSLPKITIVTPSFNQGRFIEETILSVLEQGYPDLEYLVVDGGSTDNTMDVLRKYESRITRWISEPDSGQSEAINKGLKLATGEIIGWLCSDDLYQPGALHKAAAVFEQHREAVMIHGQSMLFDENGNETVKGADPVDLWLRYFTVIPFPQPSSFFRRKLIDEQGMLDEHLHFAMDYDLLIRAALFYPILPVEDVLSKYRLHENSKTGSQLESFAREWCEVFSKFIRSLPAGDKYVAQYKSCSLYTPGTDRFSHNVNFTDRDLKMIVLYFLDVMVHLSYQLMDLSKTIELCKLVRRMDVNFFRSRNLDAILFRAQYVPSGIIKRFRRITK